MIDQKLLPYEAIKQQWNSFSTCYQQFDSTPQTHYFTLINLLGLSEAKNILQIGCGTGRMISYALNLKGPKTNYYATDLSDNMILLTKMRLKHDLQRYRSKLSFEQWCDKNNLVIQTANAQQKYQKGIKFDRIICNQVLMHTCNPQKALNKISQVAEKGCLLGISVIGNPQKNPFILHQQRILEQKSNIKQRSYCQLYKNIQAMLEKEGWEIELNFQQNSIFPFREIDQNPKFFYRKFYDLPEDKRNEAINEMKGILEQLLEKNKTGVNLSTQIIVARKKQ